MSTTKNQPGRPKDEALAARRRECILRHAIVHFARDGFAGADLDAMAADVGCAKGTLYNYFSTKAELFQQAVDLVMEGLLRATNASRSEDPLQQMEDAIRAYLNYFDEHPEYIELLIQERAAFKDRVRPTYFEHREANRERWRPRLRGLMAAGRLRQMSPDRVLDVVGDLLYGTIFTNHFAGRSKTLEQQASDVLDVVFNGLLTPEAAVRGRGKRPMRLTSVQEKKR